MSRMTRAIRCLLVSVSLLSLTMLLPAQAYIAWKSKHEMIREAQAIAIVTVNDVEVVGRAAPPMHTPQWRSEFKKWQEEQRELYEKTKRVPLLPLRWSRVAHCTVEEVEKGALEPEERLDLQCGAYLPGGDEFHWVCSGGASLEPGKQYLVFIHKTLDGRWASNNWGSGYLEVYNNQVPWIQASTYQHLNNGKEARFTHPEKPAALFEVVREVAGKSTTFKSAPAVGPAPWERRPGAGPVPPGSNAPGVTSSPSGGSSADVVKVYGSLRNPR